jgi:hypothetical protein
VADLSSVARVKQYAPLANTPNLDAKLASLVSSESAVLLAYLNIVCPYEAVTDALLDGRGARRIMLPQSPVIDVSAVSVMGTAYTKVTSALDSGFMVDRSGSILLTGGRRFPDVPLCVQASWEAGFRTEISTTVPAPVGNATTVTVTPSGGDVEGGWLSQVASIVSSGGVVFSAAANASAPAGNQYGITDGVITFNSSDGNTPVTITGYYVPGPLLQATNQMVTLALQQSINVGVKGKNILGEAISYDTTQMNDDIKAMVGPYRKMAPS